MILVGSVCRSRIEVKSWKKGNTASPIVCFFLFIELTL